ncbi:MULTISPECIES: DUF305 domain-containing protein [Streptomyces]|uniref:DUF305 domain-containing protein n=1 Tax=Streptomyces TaxID=1883 RepID=UPI00201CC9A7|nr:DUF305 domain-containing protein [Streptomyces panaciradicis]MCL6667864.1 DUF305 domain-containing protein [Streptomyces panaciradicis]
MTAFTRALRRKPARRVAAASVVAAGALLLSACGGDGDDTGGMPGMNHAGGTPSSTAAADAGKTPSAGDFNDADVTFAQMMIPHHEQALEMARLADGRAADSEVKSLAGKIEKAQDPEITAMKGWLRSWGRPVAMGDMPGMNMGDGMMSDKDMKALKAMKGAAFDKMFAQMMIGHHKGAITMAEEERKNGKNADAVKTAGNIATSQSAEVEQLQGILDRL